MTRAARLVVEADPPLAEAMRGLARQRMVFFAGLPGTGKSLLVHQLAHSPRAPDGASISCNGTWRARPSR